MSKNEDGQVRRVTVTDSTRGWIGIFFSHIVGFMLLLYVGLVRLNLSTESINHLVLFFSQNKLDNTLCGEGSTIYYYSLFLSLLTECDKIHCRRVLTL